MAANNQIASRWHLQWIFKACIVEFEAMDNEQVIDFTANVEINLGLKAFLINMTDVLISPKILN